MLYKSGFTDHVCPLNFFLCHQKMLWYDFYNPSMVGGAGYRWAITLGEAVRILAVCSPSLGSDRCCSFHTGFYKPAGAAERGITRWFVILYKIDLHNFPLNVTDLRTLARCYVWIMKAFSQEYMNKYNRAGCLWNFYHPRLSIFSETGLPIEIWFYWPSFFCFWPSSSLFIPYYFTLSCLLKAKNTAG